MQRPQALRAGSARLPILTAAAVLAWSGQALAESPAPAAGTSPAPSAAIDTTQNRLDPRSPGMHVVEDIQPLPPLVPRSKDLVAGHLLVGASAGSTWSFGHLSSEVKARDAVGVGFGAQADVGIGVSRTFVLGLWGSYARYSDGHECNSCTGDAYAVGPFVRYQLTQGLRFVPWILGGIGYRHFSVDSHGGGDQDASSNSVNELLGDHSEISGISWLRMEIGGDYYAFSGFGFGPYGGLALSTYWDRPEKAGGAAVSTELTIGLRFLLDVPGR
jgi:hypothetical protein